jgi:hypothetical protein
MGDETKTDEAKTGEAPGGEQPPPPRDKDGLPLDREPTLDDVRGGGSGRTTAVSCSVVVLLLIVAFWVLRTVVLR